MLVGIIYRPSSITSQIAHAPHEVWPLNCPKTVLAVSALQVEYPAPKNVVIKIEFTTNTTGVFCVSLTLLFKCVKYDTITKIYLFNWYVHGTKPDDFYALLSSLFKHELIYIYQLMN